MAQSWAVFDVDGTLFPPTSMEKKLILYMIEKRVLPWQNIVRYFAVAFFQTLRRNWEDGFKNNKYYLKNLNQEKIIKLAQELLLSQIIPGLADQGLRQMEQLRASGSKILLMSGSPDFLTMPLAQHLDVDFCITTVMSVANGYFTGHTSGLHPYGARKTQLLRSYQEHLDLDFSRSIVFANHHADADHLKLFGQAVAVNPTSRLKKIAHDHDWAIEWWD